MGKIAAFALGRVQTPARVIRLEGVNAALAPRETALESELGRPGGVSANVTSMADDTRLERWLDRVLARASTPRGAGVVIAAATTSITIVAGLLMTVVDGDNFPSLGSGLWWAVQTVTTVGYGDEVPTTVVGQLLAALVMLLGIGFLTVITAAITSTFVSRSRQTASDADTPTAEQLRQMNERLERIEAAVIPSDAATSR